jgi:hypothetical protein
LPPFATSATRRDSDCIAPNRRSHVLLQCTLRCCRRWLEASCFGFGAIAGAFAMRSARGKVVDGSHCFDWRGDLGLGIVMISTLHSLSALSPVMLVGGAAWINLISLINALMQNLAPDWVQARVLAIFILVYQGSFALGSATWGAIAQRCRFPLLS